MEEEKERESINWFLIILDIIIGAIILLAVNIIINVDKVYALTTTYNMDVVNIGNDREGTSVQAPINNNFNYGPNLNYINGSFTGHAGSYNAHMSVQFTGMSSYLGNNDKQYTVLVYINGVLQTGTSGSCTTNNNWASMTCNIYSTGQISNSDVLVLQLKTTGTWFVYNITTTKVSGSITIDDTTAELNNGSFNSGVNNINNNITGNTNNIINNQNQNTQDIINNQNSNSQAQIDAIEKQNLKCENYDLTINNLPIWKDNSYLDTNGNVVTGSSAASQWKISDKINVENGKTYTYTKPSSTSITIFCLYDNKNTIIGCYSATTSYTITPVTDGYIRFNISKGSITNNAKFTGEYCYNILEGTEDIEDSKQEDTNVTEYEDLDPLEIDTNDLNYMEFTLDTESNSWVWNRVTEYLNLNSIITNMTITLLAIGLIKLVLSR